VKTDGVSWQPNTHTHLIVSRNGLKTAAAASGSQLCFRLRAVK
jgi:hypothetical protein